MLHFKLLFDDRQFVKHVLRIILPATLQTLMISLMNMINIFLMGKFVGEDGVAGAALANQLFGLSLLFSYCSSINGNIFAGQYYGKKDFAKIQETSRFKVMLSLICTVLLIIIFYSVGLKTILSIFVDSSKPDMDLILHNAVNYFQYIIWTCLITSISIPLIQTVNSLGKSLITLVISGSALIFNVVFTLLSLTVFHLPWASPDNQVAGPAFSILIARTIELILLLALYIVKQPFYRPGWKIWQISGDLWKRGLKTFALLLPSEVFFQIYFIIFTIVITHFADRDTLAANTVANNLIDISWCVINGFIFSIPQIIGKPLGENKLDEAREAGKKLRTITFIFTIGIVVIIALLAWIFSSYVYSTFTPQGRKILLLNILGNAVLYFFYANSYQAFNIVRAGDYQVLPSLLDMPINYVIQLPLTIVLLTQTNMFSGWVLFTISFTYVIQYICSEILFKFLKWNRNIVHTVATHVHRVATHWHQWVRSQRFLNYYNQQQIAYRTNRIYRSIPNNTTAHKQTAEKKLVRIIHKFKKTRIT